MEAVVWNYYTEIWEVPYSETLVFNHQNTLCHMPENRKIKQIPFHYTGLFIGPWNNEKIRNN
jgi:hypothetical protein